MNYIIKPMQTVYEIDGKGYVHYKSWKETYAGLIETRFVKGFYNILISKLVRRAIGNKIGKFTKSEIMELVPSVGKTSIENSLKKLVDEGVIIRHGKGKATFYTRND